MKKKNEYAVYYGDEFLAMGTISELAEYFGVKEHTVVFWHCITNKRRIENSKCKIGKIAYKVEDDEG